MPYAQINYTQKLGVGPSIDTIADVGCFLTAFCNLLERFAENIDPPTLNNYFIAHGSYLVDGPNRDNLGWGSVSAYDGNIIASQIGGAGWPSSNDAIVKFIYRSPRTGAQVTHFCLVADHTNGTILDSWDGRLKSSPYGTPVAWSTYVKHAPQIVTPPPPVESPAFTLEDMAEKTMQFNKNTSLWDLNRRSWPDMVNNPANSVAAGGTFNTSHIAHHILGGSYYIPDGQSSYGYNVIDCQDYHAPTPPTPPAAPLQPSGNPDNKYTVIKTIPGYANATNAGNHAKKVDDVAPAEYFVYNTYPGRDDLINVTSKLGQPGSWINKADNVPDAPPAPPEPTPPESHIETPPATSTAPVAWNDTFRPFPKPIHYIATRDLTVEDLSGQQPEMPLKRYDPGISDTQGVVSAFGTVNKDGIEYYRLKTNNDPDFKFWYCIPKLDPMSHTPNLLVMPAAGGPIGKVTVARDTLQLAKSRLETDLPKFLDDMVPKFLRKNKK
jgi:hypothetical protein